MTENLQLKIARVSKILMEDMFQVKPGETVAITADLTSDRAIVDALASATSAAGGIPMIILVPRAEKESQAGMQYWPSESLTAALCKADVWIEANSMVLLYSDIWETAMRDNKKLRYLIIGNSSIESLDRIFTGFDIHSLNQLLNKTREKVLACKTVRITSKNGTDVSYDIDLNYAFDIDDGDYSKPKFGTAPGFVNIVPKIESMNGNIVFDFLQNGEKGSQLEFIMKNSIIIDVKGENQAAEKFKAYLASFNDQNMYKISHNMLGLNPKVTKLSGDVAEDERIWGGVDFGFGHTSPMDMPPLGQVAKSHFDGVVTNVSVYLDAIQIFDNGEVSHPDLKPFTLNLLNN